MKRGTPGFVGARLKEAREARGISATALAELLDVSKQAISQYENDRKTPGPDILDKISNQLNFPKPFFLLQRKSDIDETIFFRSMSSATKRERLRAKHRLSWLKDIVAYLREFVVFKDSYIPDFGIKEPTEIAFDEIDAMAADCRKFWGLGKNSINNVMMLFENNGIIVTRGILDADKLDALSEWDPETMTPYIFLGADKGVAVRSKFDLAHELGHLIMHRTVRNKKLSTPKDFKLIEAQANRFASAFLLPEETFLADLTTPSLDAFWLLKEKWRVSIALMVVRCRDLNLFDEDDYRRLWINLSRRGWRKKEPLDDSIPVEESKFLKRAIMLLIEKGIQTKADMLTSLPFPKTAIEELAGLSRGFFSIEEAMVEPLPRLKLKRSAANRKFIKKAAVIPFKQNDKKIFF